MPAIVAVILGLVGSSASATDKIWTGATDTNWGTNGNWTGNAPSAGDNALFSTTFSNQPNLSGNKSAGGIWMTGSVGQNVTVSASSGTLTLNGNTINGTAGLGILIDNTNAFSLTINAPLKIGGAQTWKNDSGNLFTMGGSVDINNKSLTVDGSGDTTISGLISNSGAFTKSGSGTLTLSNTSNSYTGQLTVQAGTLKIDTINNASSVGELGNNALAVILGSTGGVTGTLEYTGGTASSTKKFTLATGGTGAFQVDTAGSTLTLSGVVDGSGALQKTGAGTMALSGSNTYTGTTTISAGTLSAANIVVSAGSSNLGNASSAVVLGGTSTSGTLSYTGGAATYIRGFTVNTGGGGITNAGTGLLTIGTGGITNGGNLTFATNANGITVNSIISSSGGITLNSAGAGALVLAGANTYTGGTTITAGTLQLSGSGKLGSTSGALTVNGGTLDLNGTSQGVGNFTGSGGTILNNATTTNVTLTIGNNNGTGGNYSGVIADHTSGTGTIGLTKTGTGSITLSGANTFTGTTVVSGGTLILATSSGSALASTGPISVNNGGTLLLGANNQINNSAAINLSIGTFAKGNFSEGSTSVAGVGALTLSGAGAHLDFGTGSTGVLRFASFSPSIFSLAIDNWTGTAGSMGSGSTDRLIFESDQVLNLGSFQFTGFGLGAVEFALGGGLFEIVPVAAVPEPSTWFIAALAFGMAAFHQFRRWRPRSRMPGKTVADSRSGVPAAMG